MRVKRGGTTREGIKEAGQKLFQVESSINPRDPGTTTFCSRKMEKSSTLYCNGSFSSQNPWECCRKGYPFQGPKLGSCLTLGNELFEETHADKARDFIGKGHRGGEQ